LAETRRTRGWFRALPEAERNAIAQRFWQVGRLQLEPWLAPRITAAHLHPRTEITELTANGAITARFTDGTSLEADHLLLATGYKPGHDPRALPATDRARRRFPRPRPGLPDQRPRPLHPRLPVHRDFGPFFGFVAGRHHHRGDHRESPDRFVANQAPPAADFPGRIGPWPTSSSICTKWVEKSRTRGSGRVISGPGGGSSTGS
jgi:hypothetical protein